MWSLNPAWLNDSHTPPLPLMHCIRSGPAFVLACHLALNVLGCLPVYFVTSSISMHLSKRGDLWMTVNSRSDSLIWGGGIENPDQWWIKPEGSCFMKKHPYLGGVEWGNLKELGAILTKVPALRSGQRNSKVRNNHCLILRKPLELPPKCSSGTSMPEMESWLGLCP